MMDILILTIAFKTFASGQEVTNLEGKVTSENARTYRKLGKVKEEVDTLSGAVQSIQTDIAVIKNDNSHVRGELQDIKRVLMSLENKQ
jgi:uncharacterized coiled-coil DUF342 family protein